MKKIRKAFALMLMIFALGIIGTIDVKAYAVCKVTLMDGNRNVGTLDVRNGEKLQYDVLESMVPEKDGYGFENFFEDPDFNTDWDFFNKTITQDTKLYLKYFKTWKINIDLNGGHVYGLENPRIEIDGYELDYARWVSNLIASAAATSPAGMEFDRFEIDGTPWNYDTYKLKSDIMLKVFWKSNGKTEYRVTFNLDGGKFWGGTDVINVEEGQTVVKPSDPWKTGYTFKGWYEDASFSIPFNFDSETIKDDTTIYAKFIEDKVQHTITFDLNGGTFYSMSSEPWTRDSGEILYRTDVEDVLKNNVTPPANKELDYLEIDGVKWTENTYTLNSDITLKVIWRDISTTPTQHQVTFDLDGGEINGSSIYSVKVNNDETVGKPTDPVKDGYRFSGWYKDTNFNKQFDFDNEKIVDDMTIYAKYNKEYTVMIYNGNAVNLTDSKAIEGEIVTIEADDANTGMIFDKWNVLGNYTITFNDVNASLTSFKMIAQDIEIEPTYKPDPAYKEWTITYIANGGTPGRYWDDTSIMADGSYLIGFGNDPYSTFISAPAGKEFKGVEITDINGTHVILRGSTENHTVVSDVEIKYLWQDIATTPITYTILEGENQTYVIDSNKDVIIRASGDLAYLGKIKVDGVDLDTKHYDVESGSTILTLKASYLNTLAEGDHTVEFLYSGGTPETTGSVSTKLTIAKNNSGGNGNNTNGNSGNNNNGISNTNNNTITNGITNNTNNPQTSDNIMTYIITLLLSIIGMASGVTYINRKRSFNG